MYVALIGRQPEISLAELERVFESRSVKPFSNLSALVETNEFDIENLGGTLKAGVVVDTIPSTDWNVIERHILKHFTNPIVKQGKITLGISAYGYKIPPRIIEKTGLKLKSSLKTKGYSARLIVNKESSLSTATSHHNKLGLSDNKIEILIIKGSNNQSVMASSVGSQNISAYAKRDQGRPKRDPFVGMLPPKLAQIMVNLAVGEKQHLRVLDPFCGTGVILQEAVLLGHEVYGSDLSDKMISYSKENLEWLSKLRHKDFKITLTQADAMTHLWKKPIDAVATESYLGQPFSAPPSPAKLKEIVGNCNHIIESFLKNISSQIKPGTPLCVAVPAWRDKSGNLTHLPLTRNLSKLGFNRIELINVDSSRLAYYREDQVVAREILLIVKR